MDKRIGMELKEETFISSTKPIKLALLGDEHTGSLTWLKDFNYDAIDLIKRNRMWWIGMGDPLEFATKASVGSGVYEQPLNPDEQKAEWIETHRKIRKRCLGIHDGNHNKRNKELGMTETVNLCLALDMPFLASHAYHTVACGDKVWRILTTHGKGTSRKPENKINSCLDMQTAYPEADIYAMGHVHRLEYKQKYQNKIVINENEQRMAREHEATYILTGSFMDYIGSYAQEDGYQPEPAGYPVITFQPEGTFEVETHYSPSVLMR